MGIVDRLYVNLLPASPHSWVAQFDDGVGGVDGADGTETAISSALRLRYFDGGLIGAGATTNGHRVIGAGAAATGTGLGNTLSVCFQPFSCSASSKFVDLIISFAAWASSSWAAGGGTVGLSITRWMILPAWARTRDDGGGTAGGAGLAIDATRRRRSGNSCLKCIQAQTVMTAMACTPDTSHDGPWRLNMLSNGLHS